jgi:hypothetical protein
LQPCKQHYKEKQNGEENDGTIVCGRGSLVCDFEYGMCVSSSKSRSDNIGFQRAGYWLLNGATVDFILEKFYDCNNVLYAFIVDDSIKYIGKSIKTLQQRMQQYKTPGPSQSTNIKNRDNIKRELESGKSVEIYCFVDSGLFSYGGLRINLAEGLETSMITEIQPDWNR